ncbi:hypothetical protein SLE2022_034300 [Rubroshorea leprosula]
MESRTRLAFVPNSMMIAVFLLLLLLIHGSYCFNLHGVTPREYSKGDLLEVKVNTLTSTSTQLPYMYYSLPYCRPPKLVDDIENLGQVLSGDRIQNSPYVFRMMEPQKCTVVCRIVLDAKAAKEFKEKVDNDYRVNMILDDLPLVVPIHRLLREPHIFHQFGFSVGSRGQYPWSEGPKYFIHNHLAFTVKYHKDSNANISRIVGFEVKPFSVQHKYEGIWNEKNLLKTCEPHSKQMDFYSNLPQEIEEKKEITFTYNVEFQESGTKWASRWDAYIFERESRLQWFSVISSLTIILFLSGTIAVIMLRTVYADVSKYNELETQEETQDETGWEVVHGDIFRPPSNSDLLCVCVGTGVQFLGMIPITMMLAILGFLPPSNRGALSMSLLLTWLLMGYFAGYASARLHKMFGGAEWKSIALRTALMFPSILFTIFFFLNTLLWSQNSSGAMPLGTIFALVFLWLGISVPLVFIGAYSGFKKLAIEDPVVTKKVPREIPEQSWYTKPVFSILVGGVCPFVTIFVEFFYILVTTCFNQFYYISTFHFFFFIILVITCAEVSIVVCYFQLRSENYLWWWRSYFTSGASALYLFLYATYFFFIKLEISNMVSVMVYFRYMLIASFAFFVLTGTIGFYACFWFTRFLYSSLKI